MNIISVIVIGCIIIAFIIGFDIYFALDNVKNNTWSELIRSAGKSTAIIPFACGVLSGHFFWPQSLKSIVPLLGQPNSVALLVWTGCLIGIIGMSLTRSGIVFPLWISFLIGLIGGVFLWPVGR